MAVKELSYECSQLITGFECLIGFTLQSMQDNKGY